MRDNLDSNKSYNLNVQYGLRAAASSIAIAGALTVDRNMGPIVKIDPTGAQNVTMPTKASKFIMFLIHGSTNNADLTIKDSAAVTIGTLSQSEMAVVIDDGVATFCGILKQT